MAKLTEKDITQDVKSAVSAYLMARAYAETMRERIDKIETAVLVQCPLTNGLEIKHVQPAREITEPKEVYLCTDKDMLEEHYGEVNHRVRAAGLKPDDMPDSHCPALVAESLQCDTEHLIIDTAIEMLNLDKDFGHTLICNGMDKYHQFIDLVCKLVINAPGFESPLKQAA